MSKMSTHTKADRLKSIEDTVWVEFIKLDHKYRPINLGQGFPDFAAPEYVRKALADAVLQSDDALLNQYTRDCGHPRLVNALSKLYSRLIGRQIDASNEILITSGAYEALFCTFMAFVNPDDEVIIIEPYFDCYEPMTRMAGGVPIFVPLRPKASAGTHAKSADWVLDFEEFESKLSSKTKLVIVNTPNNPLGKMFTREELQRIGDLCKKYDCIIVMDEVYEWLSYDADHIRMCSLADMWDRTITIGSGGKSFSVTGWKLGWAYGPQHLLHSVYLMHQNNVASSPTPIQEALAVGFELEYERLTTPDSYWRQLCDMLLAKRQRMFDSLSAAGLSPILPSGGYFMIADISKVANKVDLSSETGSQDYKFAKWLSKEKRLQVIPVSAFYSPEHKHLAENYIRFCFIKKDSTLEEAQKIVTDLKQYFDS